MYAYMHIHPDRGYAPLHHIVHVGLQHSGKLFRQLRRWRRDAVYPEDYQGPTVPSMVLHPCGGKPPNAPNTFLLPRVQLVHTHRYLPHR